MNYDRVRLVPRTCSEQMSRNEVNLSTKIGDTEVSYPVLNAPMNTVGSPDICNLFNKNGCMGVLAPEHPKTFLKTSDTQINSAWIYSFRLNQTNILEKYLSFPEVKYFLIDVANGFHKNIIPMIKKIQERKGTFIIAGNVASGEGYKYLTDLGVNAIRVGIGVGSVCSTTINTGIGQGIVSSLIECVEISQKMNNPPLIIADGGIKEISDIAKALAIGADLVMSGRLFAGTKETSGHIIEFQKKLYKAYYGSASYKAQELYKNGKKPFYIEGEETLVSYVGSAQQIFDRINAGLRSSFTYLNARNIKEFQFNCKKAVKII